MNATLIQIYGGGGIRSNPGEIRMSTIARRTFGGVLASLALAMSSALVAPSRATAVDVGQPAPEFRLASTFGNDVSLSDFRGKKWVLLEFYGADFAPA
jgi:AhpC/TSA family protein